MKIIHDELNAAKKSGDINKMKELHDTNLNDSRITFEYALLLEKNNRINEAKILYEQLFDTPHSMEALLRLSIIGTIIKNNINNNKKILEKIYCMINEKKYNDAIKSLESISNDCNLNKEVNFLWILLGKELNVFPINYQIQNDWYCSNQIANFDPDDAINHIALHCEENRNKIKHTIFMKNINVEKLYWDVYSKLKEEKPVSTTKLSDKYVLKYDGIGLNNEDYLNVITITNTRNIITMYPVDNQNDNICEELFELISKKVR